MDFVANAGVSKENVSTYIDADNFYNICVAYVYIHIITRCRRIPAKSFVYIPSRFRLLKMVQFLKRIYDNLSGFLRCIGNLCIYFMRHGLQRWSPLEMIKKKITRCLCIFLMKILSHRCRTCYELLYICFICRRYCNTLLL